MDNRPKKTGHYDEDASLFDDGIDLSIDTFPSGQRVDAVLHSTVEGPKSVIMACSQCGVYSYIGCHPGISLRYNVGYFPRIVDVRSTGSKHNDAGIHAVIKGIGRHRRLLYRRNANPRPVSWCLFEKASVQMGGNDTGRF